MKVTRTITVEITQCSQCPYYIEFRDMGATIPYCSLLGDMGFLPNNPDREIYNECPYKAKFYDNVHKQTMTNLDILKDGGKE